MVLATLFTLGTAGKGLAWEASFDGGGVATFEHWNGVAIDQAGNLVTAGVSLYPAYSWDCAFVVTKVSRSSGTILWRQEFPDCGEDETWESSGQEQVSIDSAGDVVVGRRDIGWRTFAVYKFSGASGHLLWRKTVGEYPKHGPYAHAITLDAAGNVVVGAGLKSLENHVNCPTTEFVVSKLDAKTGAEMWRRSVMGTFLANDECEDEALNQALAVAVDGSGDVIATGSFAGTVDFGGGGLTSSGGADIFLARFVAKCTDHFVQTVAYRWVGQVKFLFHTVDLAFASNKGHNKIDIFRA